MGELPSLSSALESLDVSSNDLTPEAIQLAAVDSA